MTELTVPVNENEHVIGRANAPVTLLQYGDYECPYSGQAFYAVKQLQADFGNNLRFAFRSFPLNERHPHALQAVQAAEAAGRQGKFWEMHDMLFAHQNMLDSYYLVRFAYVLQLDIERFVQVAGSDEISRKIHDDFWSGIRSGVNGTPTFYVNGVLHAGTYTYDDLRAAVELAAEKGATV